jgi:hypothetical protein
MGVDSIADRAPPSDADATEPLPLGQAVLKAKPPETQDSDGSQDVISGDASEAEGDDDYTKKIARRLYDEPLPESEFLRMFPDARA